MMLPDEIISTTVTVDRDVLTYGFDRLAAKSIAQLDNQLITDWRFPRAPKKIGEREKFRST